MDMFTTRVMLEALIQGFVATSFLRDTFFSNTVEADTEIVDIDIEKGGQTVAPYVHPLIGGKVVARDGYQTNSYKPPEVSPEMVTTAEDLFKRMPGENIYSPRSPEERAADQLTKDLANLDQIITRREELQAAEALFYGRVTVKGEGYDHVVQYWPTDPAEQPLTTLAGANRWSESGANPTKDLEAAADEISAGSGLTANLAVLGSEAYRLLIENEKVQKLLDNRRMEMGAIMPGMEQMQGMRYVGMLNGLMLWTYNKTYRDPDTGDRVPYVPTDRVLVASTEARTTMAYGACALFRPDQQEMIVAARRAPDSWKQRKNPAGRIVQIKSRPLAVLNQIDGFHVIKVK